MVAVGLELYLVVAAAVELGLLLALAQRLAVSTRGVALVAHKQ